MQVIKQNKAIRFKNTNQKKPQIDKIKIIIL